MWNIDGGRHRWADERAHDRMPGEGRCSGNAPRRCTWLHLCAVDNQGMCREMRRANETVSLRPFVRHSNVYCIGEGESFPRLVINRLIIGRFLEKTADERGCTAGGRVSPLITAIHLSGRDDDRLSSNFVGRPARHDVPWSDRVDKIEAYQWGEFYQRTGTNDCTLWRNWRVIFR